MGLPTNFEMIAASAAKPGAAFRPKPPPSSGVCTSILSFFTSIALATKSRTWLGPCEPVIIKTLLAST